MNIMASSPIFSWQICEETVTDFIFLGSKITADGDCSRETKRRLLLGRKVMTNLDSLLKSRDITLPTKVHLVKAMVYIVVIEKAEEPEIKLPTSAGSWKKQESSRNTSISALLTMPNLQLCGSQ